MSFHNDRFPELITPGSSGGPGFRTEITNLDSGQTSRVAFYSGGRMRFDAAFNIKSIEDMAEVQKFFRARGGSANSFPYKDFLDFTSSPTNPSHTGTIGDMDQSTNPQTGDGTNTEFQLVKRYTSGLITHVRTIALPVQSTIRIWVNDVLQTEGVDYTINYTTGIVTMTSPPGNGLAVEWSGEFDVKVFFDENADEVLSASIDGFDLANLPSIGLIEDINSEPAHIGEFFYGAASEQSISSEIVLSTAEAFSYILTAPSSSASVKLPDPDNLPSGRPIFQISVDSGSANSIPVKDENGVTLATLAAGESAFAANTISGASVNEWYLLGGLGIS